MERQRRLATAARALNNLRQHRGADGEQCKSVTGKTRAAEEKLEGVHTILNAENNAAIMCEIIAEIQHVKFNQKNAANVSFFFFAERMCTVVRRKDCSLPMN